MKSLIFFLAVTMMAACGATKQQDSPRGKKEKPVLQLLEATESRIRGGAPGSGITTTWAITLKALKTGSFAFDSIWVGTVAFPVLEPSGTGTDLLEKGNVFQLVAESFRPYNLGLEEEEPSFRPAAALGDNILPPVEFEGSALLRYRYEGLTRYLIIPQWQKKPEVKGR